MLSTEEAVREHIRAVQAGEVDAVVDGYADDAVILLAPNPIVGLASIRALFESLPKEATSSDAVIEQLVAQGDFAMVTYRGPGMQGGDTFVVRDGKIVMQSAHIVMNPA